MTNQQAKANETLQRVPRRGESEEAWEINRRNIDILMSRLQTQLVERGSTRQRGWDDVGSEQHIATKLAEIVAFLGDRRAMDDLGIAY